MLRGSLITLLPSAFSSLASGRQQGSNDAPYTLRLEVAARLFDGEKCWVHPRAGSVPAIRKNGSPRMVMTMNTLDLSGSDVFRGMYALTSDDLGRNWSDAKQLDTMAPRFEMIDGVRRPIAAADFWPKYHANSQKLLGTGHTIVYTPDWKVESPRPRHTCYAVYNADTEQWSAWEKLKMPEGEHFYSAGAGCVQRYDEEDGHILLPIYFSPPGHNSRVIVSRCSFDGSELRYLEHGNELRIDNDTRGLHEPSITRWQGRYFLTIRNDEKGFVSSSEDGLHFQTITEWTFDDGSPLGNYNTQQHWVNHSDALYLVYTRRGANNDHVFRHRAPLFMAQVDTEKLCVIRNTEQIIVPERGARMGNFGVTDISPQESWVTVSEWMQPEGVEQYGSDGSVYIARILWEKPNLNVKR
jgi:hypothetical protein